MNNNLQDLSKDELLTLVSEMTTNLQTVDTKIKQFEDFYKDTFQDEGDKKSNTSKIGSLITDYEQKLSESQDIKKALEKYHLETFTGDGGAIPHKSKLESLIQQSEDALKKLIEKTDGLDVQLGLLLSDTANQTSVKTEIINIKEEFTKNLSENQSQLNELKKFHRSVFEKSVNEEGDEILSLKEQVENLKTKLNNTIKDGRTETEGLQVRLQELIEESTEKLFALTDSSLHSAFARRADAYTKEFQKVEKTTYYLTWGLVGDVLLFGIAQLILLCIGKDFNYHLLIYQFSIAGALCFAIWMFNRNQKIAKKLAEEYHHKAALAEAMTGYRNLYNLKHTDEEYMLLFNNIKDQLNINPSGKIDNFLNLKSPQEKIVDTLSEESINKLAEVLRSFVPSSSPK